jgi:hypothetical protein
MAIDDRAPLIAAVGILFLVLTWVAVSLRCYIKIFLTKPFGLDDWLSVAALVRLSYQLHLELDTNHCCR